MSANILTTGNAWRNCCYTKDEQRQEVHTAETWACPACANLSNENIHNRKTNYKEELLEVNWIPSWEPEATKTVWPTFHHRMQEF
eukprot:1149159-Pelagomonas_calceolata.AAC.5